MNKESKILITGGSGMAGTLLLLELRKLGYENILALGSKDCDLMDWPKTKDFFNNYKPDYVFHLAAAVFGIMGNMKQKGLSFFNNTLINTHVIEASRLVKVKKILAMGSIAAYPYLAPDVPLTEDMFWNGLPHASEDSYGHAKRGMLAQLIAYKENYGMDYTFAISCNLYGPYDKFDVNFGHVIPSLIRKFYEAKQSGGEVIIWGDGSAERDFLYGEDAATALIQLINYADGPVNIGSGSIYAIKDIVTILSEYTGVNRIVWDSEKPNGRAYGAYNLEKLDATGFSPRYSIKQGLAKTYDWYCQNVAEARK